MDIGVAETASLLRTPDPLKKKVIVQGFLKPGRENRSYTFKWPAKPVKTTFGYETKKYCIYPETFGIPQDLMERIHGRLGKDLNEPGCKDVFSYGFLD